MRAKRIAALALGLLLLLEPAAQAQRGGSSGGARSGGSGWGGSSSSVSRSGSSGSSSGWGGSSRPASTPAPRSSGSGWGSSSPAPRSSSTPAAPASTSSSGSSSGWGRSSPPKVTTTTTPVADRTPTSVSRKPAAPSFDKVAVADAKKAESRVNYERSQAPAATYTTPKGETKPVAKSPETEYLRGRLDQQKWVDRNQRETSFYSRYSGPAYPTVVYSDPFHPMMNYWLLSQSMNNMAMFVLCHEAQFRDDPARLRDLYARNAKLEAEVAALKARGVKADPTWYPPGVDPDLVYNDGYVTSTYNPKPRETTEYTYEEHTGPTWAGFFHGCWVVLKWTLIIAAVAGLGFVVYYAVFEHRYGA